MTPPKEYTTVTIRTYLNNTPDDVVRAMDEVERTSNLLFTAKAIISRATLNCLLAYIEEVDRERD